MAKTKAEIMSELTEAGISYDPNVTKAELMKLFDSEDQPEEEEKFDPEDQPEEEEKFDPKPEGLDKKAKNFAQAGTISDEERRHGIYRVVGGVGLEIVQVSNKKELRKLEASGRLVHWDSEEKIASVKKI